MKSIAVVLAAIVVIFVGCDDKPPTPEKVEQIKQTLNANLRSPGDRLQLLEELYLDAEICRQYYGKGYESTMRQAEIIGIQTQILWHIKVEVDTLYELNSP